MLRSIPPALSEIQASHKTDGIIDYDDFLVMRCPDRVRGVFLEVQTAMGSKTRQWPPFALKGVDQMKVPNQHVDMECASASEQSQEKIAEARGKPVRLLLTQHADAAIEIPPQDEYRPRRPNGRLSKGTVVGRPIDEERRTVGRFQAPAIPSDFENRLLGRMVRMDQSRPRVSAVCVR
jgi:hypothetical protein